MNRLNINDALLKKELAEAQARLEQKPGRWVGYEKVGRVLHWMKDSSSKDYFRQAAKIRIGNLRPERSQEGEFIVIGNYFRLAGEPEMAYNYFERAYEILKRRVGDISKPEEIRFHPMHKLIIVCFLLGRYEETRELGRVLRENDPDFIPRQLAPQIALLAEAKLTDNLALAERAIDTISASIRKNRSNILTTGSITLWDAYELGLEIVAEIEANADER